MNRPAAQAPAEPTAPAGWRRWLPHPVLSAVLAAAWLLMQQSPAPAHLLAALAWGWGLPKLLRGFLLPPQSVRAGGGAGSARRLRVALRLAAVVLWDIVVSNLTVARIVLSPTARPQPAWVLLNLTLRHPTGVLLLAEIITMTPGTVTCVVDEARHRLLVHALDCPDAPALAAQILARYEAPLKEIFE